MQPDDTDAFGNPVYTRLFGAGFFLFVEAKAGASGSPPDTRTLASISDPSMRPDVQIIFSRNLGNGSADVCDKGPAPALIGGVPGIDPPSFDNPSQIITDALNDIGCRLDDNTTAPCTLNSRDVPAFYVAGSTSQICTAGVIGSEIAFPPGDTTITVQWLDRNGNVGQQRRLVIRVNHP